MCVLQEKRFRSQPWQSLARLLPSRASAFPEQREREREREKERERERESRAHNDRLLHQLFNAGDPKDKFSRENERERERAVLFVRITLNFTVDFSAEKRPEDKRIAGWRKMYDLKCGTKFAKLIASQTVKINLDISTFRIKSLDFISVPYKSLSYLIPGHSVVRIGSLKKEGRGIAERRKAS
jgi:hypothetical protein